MTRRDDSEPRRGAPGPQRRALVTDGDSLPALGVTRSLGRAGWEVHVVGRSCATLCATSRYCARAIPAPDPTTDRNGFVRAISELVRSGGYDLLVPATDWSIIPLLGVREELDAATTVALAQSDAVRTTLSKSRTMALARAASVPTARTWVVSTWEEWARVAHEVPAPAVIKVDSSKTWDSSGVGMHHPAVYGMTTEEVGAQVRRLLRHAPVIVQERLRGEGAGIGALAHHGEALVLFQYRRLHEVPVSGGASSYRVSEALDPRFADIARRMLRALGWNGVAMLEYKHDPESGALHLVEINGRFWGSLHLAMAAGVDFPRYQAELLLDGRTSFPAEYPLGVRSRVLMHELSWLKDVLRRGSPAELAAYPPPVALARELLAMAQPFQRWDTFAADDPVPALESGLRTLQRELGGARSILRRKVVMAEMGLVRRNRRALLRRLARARSVLLVCSGNIIRSVWAELWLARHLAGRGVAVRSAGVFAHAGTKPHPSVVAYAAEQGIDASEHAARPVDGLLLAGHDVVIAMEPGHLLALRARFGPRLAREVLLLGALAPDGPLDTPDPVQGTETELRATLRRVEECLASGWP